MKSLALNTGSDTHLLDHIAPLAELINCPLAVTEEESFELAKRYYPNVKLLYIPDVERKLGNISEEFDVLIESKTWQPHLKLLIQTLFGKNLRLIFCPHGQSDKGYLSPTLAPYAFQDEIIVYGPLMIEMLQELNIPIPRYHTIGNYRAKYFEKNKDFLKKFLPKIDPAKKTLLYAPTWCDAEDSCSFFHFGKKVINELPADWNLILKIHPYIKKRNALEYLKVDLDGSNLFLIDNFPPVYPLLSVADIYLGDASSIGYDFLYFQKPLCFFPSPFPKRLHTTGTVLDMDKNLYRQIENTRVKIKEQKSLYERAFLDIPALKDGFLH